MTNATNIETITPEMSRQEGAKAAVVLIADGRLTPEMAKASGCDSVGGESWGNPAFDVSDACWCAFIGAGCEPFSTHYAHHEEVGSDWADEHWDAFIAGFTDVAAQLFGKEAPAN